MRKPIFIVGGGSSLKGFDFNLLKDKETIAVNVSALDVPNPTYCITSDSKTFQKLQDGVFKGVKTTWVGVTNENHCTMQYNNGVFKNKTTGYVYNLFKFDMLIRNAGTDGIGFTFNDFRTGYNSGFCALQLAVLLGYEEIYLLGFDLTNTDSGHYHTRYGGGKMMDTTLNKFYDNFVVALDILKEKPEIKVYSCSPISKLNAHIPYIDIVKALNNGRE